MSEVPLMGPSGATFDAAAQRAAFTDGLAPVIPIADAIKPAETPRGARRLDIRNPRDVQTAAEILVAGKDPLFARFGNILGVFGHPSAETVGGINEFKGRPRTQTGSITTTPEHYEDVADWSMLDNGLLVPGSETRLDKKTVLKLIHALSQDGPVGVLLPAADHIPGHLSRTIDRQGGELRTVQLIVPGKDCPSNDVFAAAVKQMPETPFIFATSGNVSRAVMKTEQPAHYNYGPLVEEFKAQGKGGITVITDSAIAEKTVESRHRYHDQRSTTIFRLDGVVREPDGSPVLDSEGRPVLHVQRHGSMYEGYMRGVLAEHGFGVEFPSAEFRVPMRAKVTDVFVGPHRTK